MSVLEEFFFIESMHAVHKIVEIQRGLFQNYFKALKEAFKIFDKNCNGFIEAKELKEVTTTLGTILTKEEFEEFWLEADTNKDGRLDYNEFINMMMQY